MLSLLPPVNTSETLCPPQKTQVVIEFRADSSILILLRLDVGDSSVTIERNGICVRSSVSHVAGRFCELGELGLEDGRQYNGHRKVTETVLRELADLVAASPLDYGWSRPTWTRELLALQLERETGVRLSLATLSCFLRKMGAKWKRPNMFVLCPWSRRRRARRLAAIRRLVENLPPDEAAFFEDEVDIHLNPKPGLDWMLNRQQKRILTPGQNEKCYVAGALNARNGNLVWVGGMSKASDLFIDLLKKLYRDYRRFRLIHLIVDNYSIHSSKKTQKALEALGGKIVLHFLPPYSPNHNRIEGLWKEMHANVTRNHRCRSLYELVQEVVAFFVAVQPYPGSRPSLSRAS